VRVLVVDDDGVFRKELCDLLEDEHHVATPAGSVRKAVEELEQVEFDVILTDLKMPKQSGMELLREARHRWPRTLVVMLTGFANVETAMEAMKLGAFDYLRKPFRAEQLRETLRLVALEREFESPPEAYRDPARMAKSMAASGQHEVLFFGETTPEPRLHVVPLDAANLVGVSERAESFLAEFPTGAVVIAGVERLLERHRVEDVVALLDRLRGALAGHGPLRVGFNPRQVSPSVAAALGNAVTTEETHTAIEALANPIRRKILQRLSEAPATFGDAMRAAGIDDPPKMSFHMRKLVEAGVVVHDAESYRLSTRGEAAVRLLTDVTFLPPAGDSGNLAFPKHRPAPVRRERDGTT
jgi:DNA-binding response OmpR family regulator